MKLRIGIIGDRDKNSETHRATEAALAHAASAAGVEAIWVPTPSLEVEGAVDALGSFGGLWVAPGSPYQSMRGALHAIRYARERGVPLLGTCGGFQHIVIEYARNVLGIADAAHAEYDPYASHLFISRLECSLVGRTLTIRLQPGSLVAQAYGATGISEGYYCNFGVNPDYAAALAASELAIVGSDAEGEVRVVELRGHPFFVGTLYVPQLRSQPGQPHPLIASFLHASESHFRG